MMRDNKGRNLPAPGRKSGVFEVVRGDAMPVRPSRLPKEPKEAHILHGNWREWRGFSVGMIVGAVAMMGLMWGTTSIQTAATVESFGAGLASGVSLPDEDKTDYGDDSGTAPKNPKRAP